VAFNFNIITFKIGKFAFFPKFKVLKDTVNEHSNSYRKWPLCKANCENLLFQCHPNPNIKIRKTPNNPKAKAREIAKLTLPTLTMIFHNVGNFFSCRSSERVNKTHLSVEKSSKTAE